MGLDFLNEKRGASLNGVELTVAEEYNLRRETYYKMYPQGSDEMAVRYAANNVQINAKESDLLIKMSTTPLKPDLIPIISEQDITGDNIVSLFHQAGDNTPNTVRSLVRSAQKTGSVPQLQTASVILSLDEAATKRRTTLGKVIMEEGGIKGLVNGMNSFEKNLLYEEAKSLNKSDIPTWNW